MKSLSVTIQTKATEQYLPVVLFIMLYKVVQCDLTIQIKVTEQSFLVVLFVIVVSGSVNFESVNEILKCVSCGTVYNQTGYVKNNFTRETVLSVHVTRENELHSSLHMIMTMNDDDNERKKENEGGDDNDDDIED